MTLRAEKWEADKGRRPEGKCRGSWGSSGAPPNEARAGRRGEGTAGENPAGTGVPLSKGHPGWDSSPAVLSPAACPGPSLNARTSCRALPNLGFLESRCGARGQAERGGGPDNRFLAAGKCFLAVRLPVGTRRSRHDGGNSSAGPHRPLQPSQLGRARLAPGSRALTMRLPVAPVMVSISFCGRKSAVKLEPGGLEVASGVAAGYLCGPEGSPEVQPGQRTRREAWCAVLARVPGGAL